MGAFWGNRRIYSGFPGALGMSAFWGNRRIYSGFPGAFRVCGFVIGIRFLFHRSDDGGDGSCGDGGNADGNAGRDCLQEWEIGEAHADQSSDSGSQKNVFIILCRRHDDGNKHAVNGDAKGTHDGRGKNISKGGSQSGAERPSNPGKGGKSGEEGTGDDRSGDCDGKDFISDKKTENPFPDASETTIQLLREGNGHEGIPDVNGKLGNQHIQIKSGGCHDPDTGELTGGGDGCKRDQSRLPDGKAVFYGHDSECK